MCQISDDLSCIAGTHKKWPLALYRKGTFVIQHYKLRPSLQVVLTWQKEQALNAYIWFVFTYLNSWEINIDELDRTGFGKASCWCQKWHQVCVPWSCGKPWCVALEWREKKNPSVTTKSQQYSSLSLVFFLDLFTFLPPWSHLIIGGVHTHLTGSVLADSCFLSFLLYRLLGLF